ncbi:unnamed protein product, partial [Didymodactylos carnosus]
CSLTGKDMNRNFRHPRQQTFPTIYHIKELIANLQKQQYEILAFCDLHGHSRKSNVFAYGCDGCDGTNRDMKNFLNARVLPFIMSRTAPEMFAFDYCKFHIDRCKESTGRVVMWKEMCIKNSFTLEASFAGSSIVEKPCHFNIKDYEDFGRCICHSLHHYMEALADSNRLNSIFSDITHNVLKKLGKEKVPVSLLPTLYPDDVSGVKNEDIMGSLSDCLDVLQQCQDTIAVDVSSSSESDSDPEGELPEQLFHKEVKKKQKKKRTEKVYDDRIQKLTKKRETEVNSRVIPPRGALFQSKYAKRSGGGLPIFTTERAQERRHRRVIPQAAQHNIHYDREETDGYETDDPGDNSNKDPCREINQTTSSIDSSVTLKRTASLVALNINENPAENALLHQSTMSFKPLPLRNPRTHRPMGNRSRVDNHQQDINRHNTEYGNNHQIESQHLQSPTVSIPNLLDFSKSRQRERNESLNMSLPPDTLSLTRFFETQTDVLGNNTSTDRYRPLFETAPNTLKPFVKNESKWLRLTQRNSKRPLSTLQKHQPLLATTTIENVIRDRKSHHDNNHNQDAVERVNQILKQLCLPDRK